MRPVSSAECRRTCADLQMVFSTRRAYTSILCAACMATACLGYWATTATSLVLPVSLAPGPGTFLFCAACVIPAHTGCRPARCPFVVLHMSPAYVDKTCAPGPSDTDRVAAVHGRTYAALSGQDIALHVVLYRKESAVMHRRSLFNMKGDRQSWLRGWKGGAIPAADPLAHTSHAALSGPGGIH